MIESNEAKKIFADLQNGLPMSDSEFDAIYPFEIQKVSARHWTSVEVARRAVQLLEVGSNTPVLDVGSGVGKFCIVGALVTPGFFVGIERRTHLVEFSRRIVEKWGLNRITFIEGELGIVDWKVFKAIYLFNPFVENLYAPEDRIDQIMDHSRQRYIAYVRLTQQKLNEAEKGTKVVTYHGFGGDFPPSYEMKAREPWGEDFLVLWVKEE